MFRNKLAEPYWCKYEYSEELQNKPIHKTTHGGQEFDFVISGRLKVQIGENVEYLSEGDTIFYNSSTPHGMIAVDGQDCVFLAMIFSGEKVEETLIRETLVPGRKKTHLESEKFVITEEDSNGLLQKIDFKNENSFNFAYDIVDAIAKKKPEKLAMLHLDANKVERRFTFKDMKQESARTANYFKSLGIKKGDRVLVVLKRHYQFWFTMLALHKMGAIAIPATCLLQAHDFEYRFNAAGVSAIVCTADGDLTHQVEMIEDNCPTLKTKIIVNGKRDGWHNFNEDVPMFSTHFPRTEDTACGEDTMLMLFTSGTTGYPRIAAHNYKYALGHYITAKYWHCCEEDGLHFTISDTRLGKGSLGQVLWSMALRGRRIHIRL